MKSMRYVKWGIRTKVSDVFAVRATKINSVAKVSNFQIIQYFDAGLRDNGQFRTGLRPVTAHI